MAPPLDLLARSPIFSVFTGPQLDRFVSHFTRVDVAPNTEIIRQGEPSDALYLIESGAVGVYLRNPAHSVPTMVTVLEAPEVFGEAGVLTKQPRSATCIAIESTVVHRLSSEVARSIAEQMTLFSFALARLVADRMQRSSVERDVAWVSLAGRRFDPRLWSIAPDTALRRGRMIPLDLTGNTLTVGMVDPHDAVARDTLARAVPDLHIKVVAVNLDDWQRLVEPTAGTSRSGRSSLPPEPPTTISYLEDDETRASRIPPANATNSTGPQTVALVDEIIAKGLTLNASDIHVEHDRRGLLVRYRVDGALQSSGAFLPGEYGKSIVSRMKLLARLDITETRKPQDGRISLRVGARVIDLRLSTMPAKLGEKIVLRILDAEANITDLKTLFPVERMLQVFTQVIGRPQGLVLVSGPTGSGKTTTLYSALHARRRPELNVVTVEDPIEYHLDGVTQVQVQHDIGVTFATVLRTLLRQDPNVIMVGETRDTETAHMAVEASMTGHLVLTSVHTNGALEAVGRLVDLGIEPYAIANGLIGVLHQRLVRRICAACAEPFEYPPQTVEALHRVGALLPNENPVLRRGRGCTTCASTGFKGRIALYEMVVVNEAMREAITNTSDVASLRTAARASGAIIEMPRYAGVLVAAGLTAPGEVLHLLQRATGA